jgi:hypothetical protein
MKCGRCERQQRAEYRVFSDIINMSVCADCAAEARELHLGVEALDDRATADAEEYMRRAG